MKRAPLIGMFGLWLVLLGTAAPAAESLDSLLPPPFWLRSRLDLLNVDAPVKQRIEVTYQEAEPKYHELVAKVEQLTEDRNRVLAAEQLDQEAILASMRALLAAESELTLYKVRVRLSLLEQLTPAQRSKARELAAGGK